jgi:hypothetical protein
MELKSELEIKYVECPPEHAAAWRMGLQTLIDLAIRQRSAREAEADAGSPTVSTETHAPRARTRRRRYPKKERR